jgi:hypothetical protein
LHTREQKQKQMSRRLYTDAIHCVLAWLPLHDALPAMLSCRAWYAAAQSEPSRDLAIDDVYIARMASALRSSLGRGRHVRKWTVGNDGVGDDAWDAVRASDTLHTLELFNITHREPFARVMPRALRSLFLGINPAETARLGVNAASLWEACVACTHLTSLAVHCRGDFTVPVAQWRRLTHLARFEWIGGPIAWRDVWVAMPQLQELRVDDIVNFGETTLPSGLHTLVVHDVATDEGAVMNAPHIRRVTLTLSNAIGVRLLPSRIEHLALRHGTMIDRLGERFPRLTTLVMTELAYGRLVLTDSPAPLPQLTSFTLRSAPFDPVQLGVLLRLAPNLRTLVLDNVLLVERGAHAYSVPQEVRDAIFDRIAAHACGVIDAAASRVPCAHLIYRLSCVDIAPYAARLAALPKVVAVAKQWRIDLLKALSW